MKPILLNCFDGEQGFARSLAEKSLIFQYLAILAKDDQCQMFWYISYQFLKEKAGNKSILTKNIIRKIVMLGGAPFPFRLFWTFLGGNSQNGHKWGCPQFFKPLLSFLAFRCKLDKNA